MPRKSAGLLVFRKKADILEVLLVHMGGPYWEAKDDGAWSIPKGEFKEDEEPLAAALREFAEEMGSPIEGDYIPLRPVKQPGGKIVYAWALEGDFDITNVKSNLVYLEWPPNSGRRNAYPEVDRAGWFSIPVALKKILKGQRGLILQLQEILDYSQSTEN
jgi:predicted NUDIX family NTP pyrophosphohydrolase